MKEILTVFEFTLRDALRKKAFIVSTCIILAIIVVGCAVGGFLISRQIDELTGNVSEAPVETASEPEFTCYVTADPALGNIAARLNESLGASVKFIADGDEASHEDEIKEDSSVFALNIELEAKEIAYEYEDGTQSPLPLPYLTFTSSSGIFDSTPPYQSVTNVVNNLYLASLLGSRGVSDIDIDAALTGSSYTVRSLGGIDFLGYILGILLTVLMFMAVYYYGYFVAMSVASEKTSRVMETLIMSAKPSHILIGKCAAMGTAGLLQFVAILLAGAASLSAFLLPKLSELSQLSDVAGALGMDFGSAFGVGQILLLIVYFILGYSLFAMMNSVGGASVSRTEDLQAALMPTMMIAMISFYCGYVGIFMSGDSFRRIVSLIPFTSPFIMPYRLLNDTVAPYEIVLSVALLLATIAVITAVSVRLYTASVLYYGQRLKLKDMFKLKN